MARRGTRKDNDTPAWAHPRYERYRQLQHPYAPQSAFSVDNIAAIHDAALTLLETQGMQVLCPEARGLFQTARAHIAEDTVRIGRDIVTAALATAPKEWAMRAIGPDRAQYLRDGACLFFPAGGCPNASDLDRGRRPGTLRDYREVIRLQQAFDVIHHFGPSVEPQDVPVALRHYDLQWEQMVEGDKPIFAYARGRAQIMDCFEMIRVGFDLDDDAFTQGSWVATVINTNSPRLLDRPMAQGIIDFARAGQTSIITPFCLAGAMAPVSIAGALVLQHAEALACIALAQLAKPGAPVCYGGFSSNVDMKSGSPAFGTPEHLRMQLGSGQLARHIGLPWRSAAGSAGVAADMQAAQEQANGVWGGMLSNATLLVHAAGWLEGGLTFGYEKFIADIELLHVMAELAQPFDQTDLATEALAEVGPGGHFFAAGHTMERFRDAFYPPFLADLSNHGQWVAAGESRAEDRACAVWQAVLGAHRRPAHGDAVADRLAPWIEARRNQGGAPPVD